PPGSPTGSARARARWQPDRPAWSCGPPMCRTAVDHCGRGGGGGGGGGAIVEGGGGGATAGDGGGGVIVGGCAGGASGSGPYWLGPTVPRRQPSSTMPQIPIATPASRISQPALPPEPARAPHIQTIMPMTIRTVGAM